ncbi:D-alanyl-D-alanine carboxypeptidase/D-alanyl-D-alanine endopeptidase [Streptacidiphilus fuscans]|uniref:D-alanyl-D-alanine carboxypeptidase/D-alanyl-D-alanine-endopeptidase n=1 Tax=Streptacidiphilus fuscans TaxID=2789292 RepID=A0A931B837_9ACTN|nr:D-alanyl-D-alanine carboxypeptidase/D-alanyl-D-alanine-endopeptidase [Streptacidiphilus fuscans]MBF9070407.1 D-alanyl-D-alanine carboxypeptidase/D-alanyl-D-alanine-endopeptidase [Streptacidiphilus fuscans]
MSLTARHWRRWATALTAALVTALTTAAGGPAAAHRDASLSPDIEAIMHKPAYVHAQWGLLEIDDQTGRVIHSQYPNQFFLPGSTAKLVAVSGAIHALGFDHRFTTPVQQLGHRSGSTLNGALALVAQGDLTMGGRTKPDGSVDFRPIDHTYAGAVPGAQLTPEDPLAGIDQIARQIRSTGITHVQGNVVIDNRLFTTAPAFDPAPDPLIINDNLIDLLSTPTTPGHAAKLFWRPQVAPYQVTSSVRTVAAGGPTAVTFTTSHNGTRIHVSGTIAAGSQPQLQVSGIQDPAAFGRTALIEALQRAGVTVSAPPTGPNPSRLLPGSYAGTPRVAAYVSPEFWQYVRLIFKVSHNLGANLSLCLQAVTIGSHQCGDGFTVLHRFLVGAGIDPTQFNLNDGRGGDPNDRVTPRGENELLHYWLHTPDAIRFRDTLPLMGVDGSLAFVCQGSATCPGKGKVWGKTGTVAGEDALNNRIAEGALSIGGYMEVCGGHYYTYYLVVNGASVPDINGVIEGGNDLARIAGLLQEQAVSGH